MQPQDSQNKAVTALVRSLKQALKRDHGIDVPHAALRACYLQAQGENPHAFAGKTARAGSDDELKALVAEAPSYFHPGYDFDGKKLEWLKRAGLVPANTPREHELRGPDVRRLYLAPDDVGCLVNLSLDSEGEVLLPFDWTFSKKAELLQLRAEVPKVKKYGLPDYLANPVAFFTDSFGLKVADSFRSSYEDLGDDSGDSAWVDVRIGDAEWARLLNAVAAADDALWDNLCEWVGLHYKRSLERESLAKQAEWLERYLEAHETAQLDVLREVTFEYVLPDEDGDSCSATVSLETGQVTLNKELPDYVTDTQVRTRIWSEPNCEGTDYEVFFRAGDRDGGWHLFADGLKALRREVRYMPRT